MFGVVLLFRFAFDWSMGGACRVCVIELCRWAFGFVVVFWFGAFSGFEACKFAYFCAGAQNAYSKGVSIAQGPGW